MTTSTKPDVLKAIHRPLMLVLQLCLLPRILCWVNHSTKALDNLFPDDTWVNRTAFPRDFKFGALTWAVKHEAATEADDKGFSIWDAYAQIQGKVIDGTTPADGGDEYDRYVEDVKLLKDLNMDAFKFSIAWTRMLPSGRGEVNHKAVAHYNDLIDQLVALGIEPHATLYEQDMPQVLEDMYGGLLSPKFIDDFVYYANACFAHFGDRVKHWYTFEEGNDFIPFAYAGTWCPPGRCTPGLDPFNCTVGNSSTEPYIAAHHMILAHAHVAKLYHDTYQPSQQGGIGHIIWFRWFQPLTNSTGDLLAAQRATDFTVGWFVEPLMYGEYPLEMKKSVGLRLPEFTETEAEMLRSSMDFIGLNAVTATYATFDEFQYPPNVTIPGGYFEDFGVRLTAYKDGVAIGETQGDYSVPWCMESIVSYMRLKYDNFPTYITALGYGLDANPVNETLDDTDRVVFFASYLKSLQDGIEKGANVKGIFVWSLIDGFECLLGLAKRFGIYYVDEEFNRYPRLSALWFKHILNATST